jgi:hypothetical protein
MAVDLDTLAADRGGRGTEGRIEEYPAGVVAATGASAGVRTDDGQSATGAAAALTATLAAAGSQKTYIAGFVVDGLGATAASVVEVTVTGLLGGTVTYELPIPAGVTTQLPAPLYVEFPNPIPASANNVAIVVNVPSFGAGNTRAVVSVHGYRVTQSGQVPTPVGLLILPYGADLFGWSIAETTLTAPARVRIRDGRDITGPVMASVSVPAAGNSAEWLGDPGASAEIGLFLEVVAGSVEATLYARAPGALRR